MAHFQWANGNRAAMTDTQYHYNEQIWLHFDAKKKLNSNGSTQSAADSEYILCELNMVIVDTQKPAQNALENLTKMKSANNGVLLHPFTYQLRRHLHSTKLNVKPKKGITRNKSHHNKQTVNMFPFRV